LLLTSITHAVAPTPLSFGIVFVALVIAKFGFFLWVLVDSLRLIRGARIKTKRPRMNSVTLFIIAYLCVSGGLLGLDTIAWRPYSIPTLSNAPTLILGDMLYADASPSGRVPHRGDMMVFHFTRDYNVTYVKRVVGLPGDTVQLKDVQLYINGELAQRDTPRPYTVAEDLGPPVAATEYQETLPGGQTHDILKYNDLPRFDVGSQVDPNNTPLYQVPAGSLFVLGDNRDDSSDSRFMNDLGYLPMDNLIGRATMLYFSWDSTNRRPRWDRILTSIH
jgi:signal peptidase I